MYPSAGQCARRAGRPPRLIAVLVEASDPGNAGTVIRLADAAGADGVILAGNSVDPFNPKTIRASAGSLFHLPIARAADPAALARRAVARRAVDPCHQRRRRARSRCGSRRRHPRPPDRLAVRVGGARPARGSAGRWQTRRCGCRSTVARNRSTSPRPRPSVCTPARVHSAGRGRRHRVTSKPRTGQRQPYRSRSLADTTSKGRTGSPAVSRRMPPGATGTPGRCSPRTADPPSPTRRTRSARTRRCPGAALLVSWTAR